MLVGLDEPFAELAIAFEKQLLVSFKFLASFDGQFRVGFNPDATLQQRRDHDERRGFESSSQCVV